MKKNEEYIVTCIDDTDLNSGVVKIEIWSSLFLTY